MSLKILFAIFFQNVWKETGMDLSASFDYANLQPMIQHFTKLCNAVGIHTATDADNCICVEGLTLNNNSRYTAAFKQYMDVMRDAELLDAAGLQAFEFNPAVKANFDSILAVMEQEQMEAAIQGMKAKYNVKKL